MNETVEIAPWVEKFLTDNGISSEMGPPMRYDQMGNAYVTLGHATAAPLGGPAPVSSESAAKRGYRAMLLRFLQGRKHIIWRITPEIQEGAPNQWKVYSRLTAYAKRP